jgi:hypothetical protein
MVYRILLNLFDVDFSSSANIVTIKALFIRLPPLSKSTAFPNQNYREFGRSAADVQKQITSIGVGLLPAHRCCDSYSNGADLPQMYSNAGIHLT